MWSFHTINQRDAFRKIYLNVNRAMAYGVAAYSITTIPIPPDVERLRRQLIHRFPDTVITMEPIVTCLCGYERIRCTVRWDMNTRNTILEG